MQEVVQQTVKEAMKEAVKETVKEAVKEAMHEVMQEAIQEAVQQPPDLKRPPQLQPPLQSQVLPQQPMSPRPLPPQPVPQQPAAAQVQPPQPQPQPAAQQQPIQLTPSQPAEPLQSEQGGSLEEATVAEETAKDQADEPKTPDEPQEKQVKSLVQKISARLGRKEANAAEGQSQKELKEQGPMDAQGNRLDTKGVTGKWLVETAGLVVLAFLIAMGVRMFLVEPYRIPTGSMLPAIQIDDQILIYRLGAHLGSDPEQEDIVVFYDPTDAFPNLVKRVVATEGQTVDFTDEGRVLVDGEVIYEPYVMGLPTHPLPPDSVLNAPIEYPFTVPPETVWVMGDNRTNSSDSRSFGPVPVSEVKGTAFLTYWPLSNFAPLE